MKQNLLLLLISLFCGLSFNSFSQCDPGQMPTSTIFACVGETGGAQANPYTIDLSDPGCVLGYVLHDSAGASLGNIFDQNSAGVFGMSPGTAFNQMYYISAVAGQDDGTGFPNLATATVAPGTEIVFLESFDINATQECDPATGQSTVTISVDGGFPSFDSSAFLEINAGQFGDFSNLSPGEEVTVIIPPNTDVFPIICSDQKGCEGTLLFDADPCNFDLALTKMLAPGQSSTVGPGDQVTFTIEVCNQGSITATNINVVDYVPAAFGGGIDNVSIPGPIASGGSASVTVTYTVPANAGNGQIVNYAEIASATTIAGTTLPDDDSTPDSINGNDAGGEPNGATDDVKDNSFGDEDDHDPAVVNVVVPTCDLALTKVLAAGQSSQVEIGDVVTFTITVLNQGMQAAQNISVVDYIPSGLALASGNWSQSGSSATTTIAGPVAPGSSASVDISFTVSSSAALNQSIVNYAEIAGATDSFGNPCNDVDSTADSNPGNDGTPLDNEVNNAGGDEDDHDLASIFVYGCTSQPGNMPTATVFACPGETAGAQSSGFTLDPGHTICYVLHSASSGIGNVFDVNSTGIFSQGSIPTNTSVYISAIVGEPGADGCPSLTDNCGVSNGTEVVFLAPVQVNVTLTCAGDPATNPGYTATITVTGGSPEFNNNQQYNLTGTASGTIGYNTSQVFGPYSEGTPFNVTASDSKGCSDAYTGTPPSCDCGNAPGIMITPAIITCAGSQASATQSGSSLASGDVGIYALHDAAGSAPGNIIATSATGSFTDPGQSCTQLYISYVFGPNNGSGSPDLASGCTQVLPGTPVTWVPPVSLNTLESCDNTTGLYAVSYTISGGYPACNNTALYTVTGDDFQSGIPAGTYTFGEFSDGSTYSLNVSDASGCSDSYNSPPVQCVKLPIALESLDGEVKPNGNLIKWVTGTEVNNDFFTLYRSTDGVLFNEVSVITGNGNSSVANSYSYLDREALAGLSFYKLEQTDFNGTVNYVGTIELLRGESNIVTINSLLPVPVVSELEVSYSAQEGETNVVIYDMVGRIVNELTIESSNGLNEFDINVSDLNSGIYFISVVNNEQVATKRFVKD